MIKHELARKEQIDLEPLCIIYDPKYSEDENETVPCYFSDQIHLAYRSHVGKTVDGKEKISPSTYKQCPFYENLFAKSTEAMKKHTKFCGEKEGITYTFDNGDIISVQDNFKYMGDVPFTFYFDFETTTGNAVFLTQKCILHLIVRYIHFTQA